MPYNNNFEKMHLEILLLCIAPLISHALDNGLALTPPMGWLSWERFTCNIDCAEDPANCISEKLYMDMADRIAADGFKDVGYEYINVDDCWMDKKRDDSNKLQADPVRFPSGIKALADYVHSKGLKLGIYTDCGDKTCAGYPGSYKHYDIDAETFAEWGIDMLKVDGCYAEPTDMDSLYPQITVALNNTGRPIVFSCSWPAYQVGSGMDILAGNFGLSYEEAKAQFALWAIMASPLLLSNDLRSLDEKFKDLLTNKEIIAVNQDCLGIMGKRIYNKSKVEIWKRPISPVNTAEEYSQALVFFNRRTLGGPVKVTANLNSMGLTSKDCYTVYDVFTADDNKKYCPADNITVSVNPSGVTMVIAKVLNS